MWCVRCTALNACACSGVVSRQAQRQDTFGVIGAGCACCLGCCGGQVRQSVYGFSLCASQCAGVHIGGHRNRADSATRTHQNRQVGSLDTLEENWQRILAARQEVILAGRTYDAERRQFEMGLRTSTEVFEAAARLAGAQSREIRALTAYEISQVDRAYACGALLGRDRAVFEPVDPR